jgi:flagellar biosynthesis/type III secretory pathway protein FliH
MSDAQQTLQPDDKPKRDSALRDERLQQLMESCQQEVLRQIIGPFGLTPAMFDDKDGGNVTTQHNAEKGIFAKESEEFDRADYYYAAAKREKMRNSVQNGSMNSQEFEDTYTGKTEQTKRTDSNGKLVINAELDHCIPVKDIHGQGGWMKDKGGRTELSSAKDNLHYTTHKTNRSKSDKSPKEALSEENGFDKERIDPLVDKAKEAIEKELPSNLERSIYHGKDLAKEGAKDAGKSALRQALGVVLHEFVSASFSEIKTLLKDDYNEENLIDRLVESLKCVMNRVINKCRAALEAALHGGVEGFISNLLTFLINNLITTSRKIVTIIRDSMRSLWRAIKLMVNPPEGMSALEITREVTKIIAAAVTTGLGMLMEESVKGFIISIPFLVPIAEVLATGLTAIMTGIAGALIVFGIDRLFDWLSSTDTELLAAQETYAEAQTIVISRMQTWLNLQFENSHLYEVCVSEYKQIQASFSAISFQLETALLEADASVHDRNSMIETVETQIDRKMRLDAVLKSL